MRNFYINPPLNFHNNHIENVTIGEAQRRARKQQHRDLETFFENNTLYVIFFLALHGSMVKMIVEVNIKNVLQLIVE
jgi:hypothetical protein